MLCVPDNFECRPLTPHFIENVTWLQLNIHGLLNAQNVYKSSSSAYFLGWSMWVLYSTKWY